ncbi:MAG TPA: MFS transporter [Sulfolobales archaeon]|nr:MFS transporter [Sulfolobales archaeon]
MINTDGDITKSTQGKSYWPNVVASAAGWGLDAYDWISYAALVPILSAVFFKPLGPLYALLSTIVVFSLSLVVRPLGGVLFGRLGDKYGRKLVLYICMIGAGLASFLMGFLPTYDQAGIWGPILLLTLRIVLGLFIGGEYSASGILAVESVTRWRGLAGGIMQAGFSLGELAAFGVYTLVALSLTTDQLYSIGWRIVFWSGIITTIIGLVLRTRLLRESPEWEVEERKARAPVKELFTGEVRIPFMVVLLATMGWFYAYYTLLQLASTILNTVLGISPALTGIVLTAMAAVDALGSVLGGLLVDLVGSKKAIMLWSLMKIVAAYPVIYFLLSGNPWMTLLWDFIVVGPVGMFQVYIYDLIPLRVRATAAGLGYNGGLWLGAWAAPIATLLSPSISWLYALTLNTMIGGVMVFLSALLSMRLAKVIEVRRVE